MKYLPLHIFLIIVLVFTSCNSEDEQSSITQEDKIETNEIIYDTLEGEPELTYPDPTASNEMPKDEIFEKIAGTYTAITLEEGKEPYIYHYCEAEDPAVIIDKQEGQMKLFVAYGQDGDSFTIESLYFEVVQDTVLFSEYSLVLYSDYRNKYITATALVNEENGHTTFTNDEEQDEPYFSKIYVNEKHLKDIKEISENCDYLDEY